jgi:hypothetical protein
VQGVAIENCATLLLLWDVIGLVMTEHGSKYVAILQQKRYFYDKDMWEGMLIIDIMLLS